MKLQHLAIGALLATTSACAMNPGTVDLFSSFDPEQVAWFKDKGDNAIEGSALIRQQGGDVVTCAGYDANLVPAGDHATERISKLYGSTKGGYFGQWEMLTRPSLEPAAGEYLEYSKQTVCNPQGEFSFSNLPDGDYYVTTQVMWKVGYSNEGGFLAKRVRLEGGETQQVVLRPE